MMLGGSVRIVRKGPIQNAKTEELSMPNDAALKWFEDVVKESVTPGDALRVCRKEKGLSQTGLAAALG